MISRVKPIYFPKPAFEYVLLLVCTFQMEHPQRLLQLKTFFCPVGEYRAACSSSCHIFLRIGKKRFQLCLLYLVADMKNETRRCKKTAACVLPKFNWVFLRLEYYSCLEFKREKANC